jgi:hypothetical protein
VRDTRYQHWRLDIKERYSLFRPSHTLDETPDLFWLDVLVGCFVFGGIAIWKIAQVLSHALCQSANGIGR